MRRGRTERQADKVAQPKNGKGRRIEYRIKGKQEKQHIPSGMHNLGFLRLGKLNIEAQPEQQANEKEQSDSFPCRWGRYIEPRVAVGLPL